MTMPRALSANDFQQREKNIRCKVFEFYQENDTKAILIKENIITNTEVKSNDPQDKPPHVKVSNLETKVNAFLKIVWT